MREVEKANDEIQAKLTKKEREAEIRGQEKEELLETVNKMKTKLEKETAGHLETKQHIQQLNRHIEEIKAQVRRGLLRSKCRIIMYINLIVMKCLFWFSCGIVMFSSRLAHGHNNKNQC